MAGLLTHLLVGLAGALIIYFALYKSKPRDKAIYGIAFLIANIAPDIIDFGILSIKMGTLNPDKIMSSPSFHALAALGHTFSNWAIIAIIAIAIAFLLYKIGKISKENCIKVVVISILVLIGVLMHFKFDSLIQEKSHWL